MSILYRDVRSGLTQRVKEASEVSDVHAQSQQRMIDALDKSKNWERVSSTEVADENPVPLTITPTVKVEVTRTEHPSKIDVEPTNAEVREWAREQGYEVSPYGKPRKALFEEYKLHLTGRRES